MDPAEDNCLEVAKEEEVPFDKQEMGSCGDVDVYSGKLIQPTDLGNAERMVQMCGSNIRFCHALNKFLIWDGKRWSIDDTGVVNRYAKDTIRNLYLLAGADKNDNERKALVEHAQRSESKYRLSAMIELVKHEYGVPIRPEDLDKDRVLLNCLNGTYNLITGEFQSHDRDDFITKIVPVEYDIGAECPHWLEFLDQITGGDEGLQDYLQRCVGYSASGDTSEQAWFLLHGSGANGKSTFLNTISLILNDYSSSTPPETFLLRNNDMINNDVARLKGARFVTALEPEEGRRLNEGLIKLVTGGDPLTARYLYGEYFQYVPTFKIWISSNHRPEVKSTSYATWRRIRAIPFEYQIPESQRVRDLHIKLFKEEAQGIFNWIIGGFNLWQFQGLGAPEAVQNATNEYKNDMDMVSTFISNCCVVASQDKISEIDLENIARFELSNRQVPFVQSKGLFDAYINETGDKASQKAFTRKMHEKGYPSKHFKNGTNFIGIGLLDKADFEPEG